MGYSYLFMDYPSASMFLNRYRPFSGYISISSGYVYTISIFYDCLITLASDDKKETLTEQVKLNISKLRHLSESSPMSYLNKVHFLEAEIAAVQGDVSEAIANYEEAISLSKKYGLRNEEAMACERAAMFYLSLNSSSSASKYLFRAYRCYDDWGAKSKIHQLTKKYPKIFVEMKNSSAINFTGMQLEKESEASVSLMSQSEMSRFTRDDEYCKLKRKSP